MPLIPADKHPLPEARDSSGIALFMVIAAVSVLTILVTEFSYIAQINQRMAYDSLDQVKAHYLAKSGFKLSLLRLKAYAQIKAATGGSSSSNPLAGAIPKGVLEKIWNFPFIYPVPALPGMSIAQKDQLDEFQKSTDLDGHFTALIESESTKYNINSVLKAFAPNPNPSASPGISNSPNPTGSFDASAARQSLQDYLPQLITNKSVDDDDFAREYRDFKLDDLIAQMAAWADRTYTPTVTLPNEAIPPKQAPYYSLTELHMVYGMDDKLYKLFEPALTAANISGININSMQSTTLKALLPQMTVDEVTDFFKFRDDDTTDNLFKKVDDFYDYLQKNVAFFRNDKTQVQNWQQALAKRGINLLTEESGFKITVQAQVNQAVRTIEAWVTLTGVGTSPTPSASNSPSPQTPALSGPGNTGTPLPDSGLKITFMRVL